MVKEEEEGLVDIAGDEDGVCAPQGFAASGVIAGIKVSGNPDMASIIDQGPKKTAAAIFTTNRVQAVPVTTPKKHIADGKLSAVVLNSDNANACNGQSGATNALKVRQKVANEPGVNVTEIGTCSTGLIDDRLPMDIVLVDMSKLCENPDSDAVADTAAAEAVLAADSVAKQVVAYGDGFTAGAMGEDVGMTNPSMAIMLGVITTDTSVSAEMVHEAIAKANEVTFSRLDINGSISTSDTVIILTNDVSGMRPSQEELDQAMLSVRGSTARQTQSNAEGVTKRVSMTMRGTGGMENTLVAARIISRDNLLKCAVFGSNPNWGRMLATISTVPVDMNPEHITIPFNGYAVCRDTGGTFDAHGANLSDKDIAVEAGLGIDSPEGATIRMTNLSHDYVHVNSAYSS